MICLPPGKWLASPFISFWVYFLLAVGCATLSWYCLEQPFNNLKKLFDYVKPKKKAGSRSGCLDYLKKLIGRNNHFLSTGILYLIRILKWIFNQYKKVIRLKCMPIARFACSRAICGFAVHMIDLIRGVSKIMGQMFSGISFSPGFVLLGKIILNGINYFEDIRHALTGKKIAAGNIVLMYPVKSKFSRTVRNRIMGCNTYPHFPVFSIMYSEKTPQFFIY